MAYNNYHYTKLFECIAKTFLLVILQLKLIIIKTVCTKLSQLKIILPLVTCQLLLIC